MATGSPANLTAAVDASGFSTAITATSIICGALLLVTAAVVARAVSSRPAVAVSGGVPR